MLSGTAERTYDVETPVGIEVGGNAALFKGDYKITRNTLPWGDARWRLYHLASDPGETLDLSGTEPELFAALQADYGRYQQRMGVLPLPDSFDHLRSEGARVRGNEGWLPEHQDHHGSEPQAALEAGNDLRHVSKETLEILSNREVIALNQDKLAYQARRLRDEGEQELWAKPLEAVDSGKVGVVLFNRDSDASAITLRLKDIGLDASQSYVIRDLWKHQTLPNTDDETITFDVPAYGVIALRVEGTEDKANNPFRPENADTFQVVEQNFYETIKDYLFVHGLNLYHNLVDL